MHWHHLAGLEEYGGAASRKYDVLTEQAHGAQPGSPAHLAKVHFEEAWVADPVKVRAICEAEEGPPTEPEPKTEEAV
jgi:hypothetical protein